MPPLQPARRPRPGRRTRAGRILLVATAGLAVAVGAFATAVYLLSGASLAADPTALAHVRLQPFAGSIVSLRASRADGAAVALRLRGGRLVPRTRLAPGETIAVTVIVRPPGWSSWALGHERTERLSVRTPVAHVKRRWVTVAKGARPRVRFDVPVAETAIDGRRIAVHSAAVTIPTRLAGGSAAIAAAARPWELLGAPTTVTWFPRADHTAVLTDPRVGAQIGPLTPLRLTFSEPVSVVVPGGHPTISTAPAGRWEEPDSHTLVFRPAGSGAPFDSEQTVRLPTTVAVVGGSASTRALAWHVAPASFLRLQQLLAQEGYLPLSWSPSQGAVGHSWQAELAAATSPPPGRFRWRFPNTPPELRSLWHAGQPDQITRGAVMTFEHDHQLAVDGIAGPRVWHAALADAVAQHVKRGGYSYVFVHRNVPQLLTLWHDGRIILTSPGNTGVPAAPTPLGTWPVFEHIPVGRMSGTNPDGSHYDDPGIRWISYFHGGEALHAFNRASFGTPQSLGCVELPLAAAKKVWPYTPIGTLVTIES